VVFAVVMCLSVHLSVCHKPVLYRNSWTNRAGFGIRLPLTYPTLCCKKIWISPKIRVLPLCGTLSQTLDLEILDISACWQYLTRSTRRGCLLQVSQVSPSDSSSSICCAVVHYNLFLQLCSSSTDSASCSPSE